MLINGANGHFLSHLCGDEVGIIIGMIARKFLSHLCGDEDSADCNVIDPEFLSHLCGDEEQDSNHNHHQ